MRRFLVIPIAIAALLAVVGLWSNRPTTAAAKPTAAPKRVEPGAKPYEELVASNFERSETIDNPWWPLEPGTQMVYEGFTEGDGEKLPHRLVSTVTDLTRMVAGVRARVVHEADYTDGKMIEQELAYFAQDKAGNVWHLGEYRETFEDEFVGGRIFYPGQPEGAKGGIMVPANPQVGTPSFSEGYVPPPFMWTDRGRVYQLGQKTKVGTGSYDDVLVIEEFDENYPGAFQLKYFAKGVGNVRVGWRGTGADKETLELMKIERLNDQQMEGIRANALEMEKRALIYCTLPPMERAVRAN